MHVDFDFNLTPEEFITNNQKFIVQFNFTYVKVSIVSQVKIEDGIYNLYISGTYPRSSELKVGLSPENTDVDIIYKMASAFVKEYVPIFITEDYPDSLKKVEEDKEKKKVSNKDSIIINSNFNL